MSDKSDKPPGRNSGKSDKPPRRDVDIMRTTAALSGHPGLKGRFEGNKQRGCLAGDTEILMANGMTRPISALRAGDVVMSVDANGDRTPHSVKEVVKGTNFLISIKHGLPHKDHLLRVSPSHKLMTHTGPKRADQLKAHDRLQVSLRDGTCAWSPVHSTVSSAKPQRVFNVRLNGSANILAGTEHVVSYNYSHARQLRQALNQICHWAGARIKAAKRPAAFPASSPSAPDRAP